jgi:predicted acetyltransferase
VTTELLYDAMRTSEEEELAGVLGRTFAFPPADAGHWFDLAGREHIRVVRSRRRIEGGLLMVPMGQAFGGAWVPMVGIAGVGVRADARRAGIATFLMRRTVAEIGERGALSTLYASNAPLYRRAGYEAAGARFRGRVNPREIHERTRELELVEIDASRENAVRELYSRVAVRRNGHLDRGRYIWQRVHGVRFGVQAHGLGLVGADGMEGYLFHRQSRGELFQSLEITDWIAATPRAHRQLWTTLADIGTMVEDVVFPTAPHDPILLAHPDPRGGTQHQENWMLRVADVPRALESRGWPPAARARLSMRVRDDVVPGNDRAFVVDIADGRCAVEPGGTGEIEIDVRGLASLYSGFVTPWTLRELGGATADDASLAALAVCFGDGTPWMQEMF